MSRILRYAILLLSLAGIEPGRPFRFLWRLPGHLLARQRFQRASKGLPGALPMGMPFPCLFDRDATGGSTRTPYFHQDLLVARRIHTAMPRRHLDVGSRVDGFVAHVASFREIEVLDIRPMHQPIPGIVWRQADLMQPVPPELRECADSLSCLHALEHFGLGRYGDPLDPLGHMAGFDRLHDLLAPGGTLYLSMPIGRTRVEFDAHRVFSVPDLLALFAGRFRIVRLCYVDDAGGFHADAPLTGDQATASFGCHFGCGIVEAVKL